MIYDPSADAETRYAYWNFLLFFFAAAWPMMGGALRLHGLGGVRSERWRDLASAMFLFGLGFLYFDFYALTTDIFYVPNVLDPIEVCAFVTNAVGVVWALAIVFWTSLWSSNAGIETHELEWE
jgi:hypothetical protein